MSVGRLANASGGRATARTGWHRGAAGGAWSVALPWCCGRVGEGAGGERQRAAGGAADICVSAAAILAGGPTRVGGRIDDGAVVSRPSALGSGDAVGGQRAVPADGALVGDGARMAWRPCGVRDGAGAGDGTV